MSLTHSRREFLDELGASGAALAGRIVAAQHRVRHRPPVVPRAASSSRRTHRAELDRRLLGAFLEHLGRSIYTGVVRAGLAAGGHRTASART